MFASFLCSWSVLKNVWYWGVRSPITLTVMSPQKDSRCVNCPPRCFPDSEHDVWPCVGAAAPQRGAGQEDRRSGGQTGLHPSQCAVAARCAFSGNNKATKGFPGRLGLSSPFPVILPVLWMLFSPCQAALSRTHHTRDTIQLLGHTQSFFFFSLNVHAGKDFV